jgi:lysophospholipase L1-like esterase
VTVEGGLIAPEEDEAMRLLIFGDSITCGHSNMRPDNAPDANNSTNENGLLTYAMRTAAMLNADAHVFARSGLGLYTNPYNSTLFLKDIYGKVSPLSDTDWDMTSWIPDAVVINIGTNDIWTGGFSQDAYIDAYVGMVRELVDIFGDQVTFFLCSSMMAAGLDGAVQRVSEELLVNHGITAYFVDLPHQMNPSGHPTNPSHEAAAEVLYRAITDRMGY